MQKLMADSASTAAKCAKHVLYTQMAAHSERAQQQRAWCHSFPGGMCAPGADSKAGIAEGPAHDGTQVLLVLAGRACLDGVVAAVVRSRRHLI